MIEQRRHSLLAFWMRQRKSTPHASATTRTFPLQSSIGFQDAQIGVRGAIVDERWPNGFDVAGGVAHASLPVFHWGVSQRTNLHVYR